MKTSTMIHLLTHADGLSDEFLTRAAANVEALRAEKSDDPAVTKAKADDADAIATALDAARARAVPATDELVSADNTAAAEKAPSKR